MKQAIKKSRKQRTQKESLAATRNKRLSMQTRRLLQKHYANKYRVRKP